MKNTNKFSYLVRADLARYTSKKSLLMGYLREPIFRYVYWLRVVHCLKQKRYLLAFAVIPYLILKHMSYKLGIFIDSNLEIGPGLHVVHGGCVYVNATRIGSNFTIYQGVTLGCSNSKNGPAIDDNVTVYAGAKVLGEIVLGKNCVVGANAVVTHSFSNEEVLVGAPARPIGKK